MQTTVDIRELQERIERESSFVDALTMGMNHVIVGQKHLVESLLIGLFGRWTHSFGRCTWISKNFGNQHFG